SGAERPGSEPAGAGAGGSRGVATGAVSETGGDAVYGAAVGVRDAPRALERTERFLCRYTDRRAQPDGNRAADRLLRQHPGAALGPLRVAEVPGRAAPDPGDDSGGVHAPGAAIRAAGGGAETRPQPEPDAAVPGGAGLPEQPDARAAPRRFVGGAAARAGAAGEVRSRAQPGGPGRGSGWDARVLHRPVRAGDDGAPAFAPGDTAVDGGGRSGAAYFRAAAAGRCRALAGAGRAERDGAGVPERERPLGAVRA